MFKLVVGTAIIWFLVGAIGTAVILSQTQQELPTIIEVVLLGTFVAVGGAAAAGLGTWLTRGKYLPRAFHCRNRQ